MEADVGKWVYVRGFKCHGTQKYFECTDKHGILTLASKVALIDELAQLDPWVAGDDMVRC